MLVVAALLFLPPVAAAAVVGLAVVGPASGCGSCGVVVLVLAAVAGGRSRLVAASIGGSSWLCRLGLADLGWLAAVLRPPPLCRLLLWLLSGWLWGRGLPVSGWLCVLGWIALVSVEEVGPVHGASGFGCC